VDTFTAERYSPTLPLQPHSTASQSVALAVLVRRLVPSPVPCTCPYLQSRPTARRLHDNTLLV